MLLPADTRYNSRGTIPHNVSTLAGMGQYAASPLFVSGLYNMAFDNLLESGVEEKFNNACYWHGPADTHYEQPVSLLKLEEDHYEAQPLLWAPLRSSECSEASDAFFLADRYPCSRQELSYDARGALYVPPVCYRLLAAVTTSSRAVSTTTCCCLTHGH